MALSSSEALSVFASALGWKKLTLRQHQVDDRSVITWFETGSADDIMLQINKIPCYAVAVFAVRYRICTGWHRVHVERTEHSMHKEAQRLREWFDRKWFDSLEGRRTFRRNHPECSEYSWRKLRENGPPYQVTGDPK